MLAERADPNAGFKNLERQVLSGPERMDGQITRYFAAMAIRPKLNPLRNIRIGYPQILTVSERAGIPQEPVHYRARSP